MIRPEHVRRQPIGDEYINRVVPTADQHEEDAHIAERKLNCSQPPSPVR